MDPTTIAALINTAGNLFKGSSGGVGNTAVKPKDGGATAADAMFGSNMFSVDSSGWLINVGSGRQGQENAARSGPSMTNTQTPTATNAAAGGYAATGVGAPTPAAPGAASGSFSIDPMNMIMIATVAILVLKK